MADGVRGLALADLDGDSDLDAVTADYSYNGSQLSVLTGSGSGSFGARRDLGISFGHRLVAAADLDGDTDLDLLTLNSAGGLTLWRRDAGGTYTLNELAGLSNVSFATLADLDGDLDLDLVLTRTDRGSRKRHVSKVSVLPNIGGAALFGAAIDYARANSINALALGDTDGDGDLEVVTAGFIPLSKFGSEPGLVALQEQCRSAGRTDRLPQRLHGAQRRGGRRPQWRRPRRPRHPARRAIATRSGCARPMAATTSATLPWAAAPTGWPWPIWMPMATSTWSPPMAPPPTTASYGEPSSDLLTRAGQRQRHLWRARGPRHRHHPGAAVLGDLNGDGRLDLITANQSANPQSSLTALARPARRPVRRAKRPRPGLCRRRHGPARPQRRWPARPGGLNSDPRIGQAAVLLGQSGGGFGAATLLTTGLGAAQPGPGRSGCRRRP